MLPSSSPQPAGEQQPHHPATMADPQERLSLVADSTHPAAPATTTSPTTLRPHHYFALLALLLAATSALSSALATPWTLLALLCVAAATIAISRRALHHHKPAALPWPFLLTQLALGAFVAPAAAILIELLALAALTAVELVLGVLAMYVTGNPRLFDGLGEAVDGKLLPALEILAGAGNHSVLGNHTQTGSAASAASVAPAATSVPAIGALSVSERVAQAVEVIAGGTTMSTLFISVFAVLVLFFLLAHSQVHEYVRWKLFKRYAALNTSRRQDGPAAAAQALGADGLATVACAGALGMATYSVYLSASFDMHRELHGPFFPLMYAGYIASTLVVEIGTQLFVVSAFIEKELALRVPEPLSRAWVISVLFRPAMVLLSAFYAIPMMNEALYKQFSAAFGVVGRWYVVLPILLVQISVAIWFCRVAYFRFRKAAVDADIGEEVWE